MNSKTLIKAVNVVLIILISLIFYTTIKNRVYKATGTRIFTGFSGWQLGTNACYSIKDIDNVKITGLSNEANKARDFVLVYNDSLRRNNLIDNNYNINLLFNYKGPFKQFQNWYQQTNKINNEFKGWTKSSVYLNELGWAIIRQYPYTFTKNYLLPNWKNYLNPDLENLNYYLLPNVKLYASVLNYYRLPKKITNSHQGLPAKLNSFYKPLYLIISILFLFILFVLLSRFTFIKTSEFFKKKMQVIAVLYIFYLSKMLFDVFAAPVDYRYVAMCFPFMLSTVFYFIDSLIAKFS